MIIRPPIELKLRYSRKQLQMITDRLKLSIFISTSCTKHNLHKFTLHWDGAKLSRDSENRSSRFWRGLNESHIAIIQVVRFFFLEMTISVNNLYATLSSEINYRLCYVSDTKTLFKLKRKKNVFFSHTYLQYHLN